MRAILALLLAGPPPDPAPLNDGVVAFARARLGQQVGDGQCTDLAVGALRAAGARPNRGGRGWGEELPTFRDARPGDILQFEGAVFVHRGRLPGGAVVIRTARYAHHTAIVATVRGRAGSLRMTVLHQHATLAGEDEADHRIVKEWDLNPAELRRGTVTAYRPVADRPADPP